MQQRAACSQKPKAIQPLKSATQEAMHKELMPAQKINQNKDSVKTEPLHHHNNFLTAQH